MTPAYAERYALTDAGLTRYVRDSYAYRLGADGREDSPLGSHVNAYTAGGLAEGGYLGFVELQYVHMPLPGERLVVFLSDGAFEEQRGSDWAPRWWRAEDSGLVTPIMINNGRRIDQRTTMSQQDGVVWFRDHLRLNGFAPMVFDGRDPAAFVWAILEMERRLEAAAAAVKSGHRRYSVPLPYGIAVAPKGAGFPGEGTNLAHNLPLMGNPRTEPHIAARFNEGVRRLWVPLTALQEACHALQQHAVSGRPRERDHALAQRTVQLREVPQAPFRPVAATQRREPARWTTAAPMTAVDTMFAAVVQGNPQLRPRVGNPDEMRSNRLLKTLELLKFRVTDPEPGIPETLDGAVMTALTRKRWPVRPWPIKGESTSSTPMRRLGPRCMALSGRKSSSPTTVLRPDGRRAGCPSPLCSLRIPGKTARTNIGYLNQGGTLNTPGMLYVNRCSWAHCLAEVAELLDLPRTHLLSAQEIQALDSVISPHGVIIPEVAV